MNTQPIIVEQEYNAAPAKVWAALTDADEMRKWYFDLPEFRPEAGFNFQFTGGPADGVQYLHLCEVTEVVPQKKLTYSWRYDGYEGNSFVTFDLLGEGEKTRLKLTHMGLESFPQENPDFAVANFEKGWEDIVRKNLRGYVEGSDEL
jgi:uncharacterized protein YndB with AHSA1/START domain